MSEIKYGKTALIDDVTTATGMRRKAVAQVVNATLATIQQRLQDGQPVTLTGFGSFKLSQRQPRNGVNPHTRLPIRIPAHTSARWKPSAGFMNTKR
jgi:DNA-binding protein HU-beta